MVMIGGCVGIEVTFLCPYTSERLPATSAGYCGLDESATNSNLMRGQLKYSLPNIFLYGITLIRMRLAGELGYFCRWDNTSDEILC